MNTDKPHVGTITIPLTPEQERQLQEHAAACPACAEVNAGQAPTETRCDAGNALIWSFGVDLRNAAFEAASNIPTPPDWLTPKEREFKAVRGFGLDVETRRRPGERPRITGISIVRDPEGEIQVVAEKLAEMFGRTRESVVSIAARHGLTFPERSTIDAPPPPDLLEATRPEPSLYAKIYTNAEIDPPIRVPTAGELEALRPYTDFSEFGGIVAAMAFAIHVENRGTIPCPGRTVAGCGDGEDECDYCGSTGEISILAPPSPDPGEHPDPFVREVVGAVRALGSPRTGKTDLGFLRCLAAYDNARHAPNCHPCPGTLAGSGEAEGEGCDEEHNPGEHYGKPYLETALEHMLAGKPLPPAPWERPSLEGLRIDTHGVRQGPLKPDCPHNCRQGCIETDGPGPDETHGYPCPHCDPQGVLIEDLRRQVRERGALLREIEAVLRQPDPSPVLRASIITRIHEQNGTP